MMLDCMQVGVKMGTKEIDCWGTEYPTCPYCGEMDQDWWDGRPNANDSDSWVTRCGFCMKNYTVDICIDVSFSTEMVEKERNLDEL